MERLTRAETGEKIIYTLGHTRWTFDKRDHSRLQDVLDWLFEYQALGTVDELSALVKAQDEGRVATWPAELWAVKLNPGSTEYNDQPEHHIVHYIVHAYEPGTGRYFVNTDSYPGLKHRHWIKGKGLYKIRAEAEAALGGGGDG